MMGSGAPKRGSGAFDDLLALAKVVSEDETYRQRAAELTRLEQEAQAAKDEADKARLAADQERQAAVAAATHNANRTAELKQALTALEDRKAEVDAEQVETAQALHAESERLKKEAAQVQVMHQTLAGQIKAFEEGAARKLSEIAEKGEAATTALEAAIAANERAAALEAKWRARLAKIQQAASEDEEEASNESGTAQPTQAEGDADHVATD